jgi:hypothetical protein
MERAVQICVEHTVPCGVIGGGDGLATGEGPDQMGEDVNLAAARDDRVYGFFRRVEIAERGWKCNEIRMVKIRLLDPWGQSHDFSRHRLQLRTETRPNLPNK